MKHENFERDLRQREALQAWAIGTDTDAMIQTLARENAQRIMAQEPIVIPMLDRIEHTEVNPFCPDPLCPCRQDRDNINLLNDLLQQGLLTPGEAALILRGATI